jgi:hypothetical protein
MIPSDEDLSKQQLKVKKFLRATDQPRAFLALEAYKGDIDWNYSIHLSEVVAYLRQYPQGY